MGLAGVEPFCRAYGSFKTKPGLKFWGGGGSLSQVSEFKRPVFDPRLGGAAQLLRLRCSKELWIRRIRLDLLGQGSAEKLGQEGTMCLICTLKPS